MENDELLIVKCSIEIFRHVMYLDKNKRKHVPNIWIEELNLHVDPQNKIICHCLFSG